MPELAALVLAAGAGRRFGAIKPLAEVRGQPLVRHAIALADEFQKLVTGRLEGAAERKALGKLQALAGVSEYPVRVKCASLAWHTLKAALAGAPEPISTE